MIPRSKTNYPSSLSKCKIHLLNQPLALDQFIDQDWDQNLDQNKDLDQVLYPDQDVDLGLELVVILCIKFMADNDTQH